VAGDAYMAVNQNWDVNYIPFLEGFNTSSGLDNQISQRVESYVDTSEREWGLKVCSIMTSVSNPVYTDTGIPVFGTPNTDTGKNLPVLRTSKNGHF
jgi:hypothetical protein